MSFFNINYEILSVQLLPVRLRKNKMKAWISCLTIPIRRLYSLFMNNRGNNLYYLSNNSQVCNLESVLNDVFDPAYRGIYIEDGLYNDPLFTFLFPELKPQWLATQAESGMTDFDSPAVLFTNSETSLLTSAFIVRVPASLSFEPDRMKALINKYRIPGKSVYEIQTY